ncbi:restriction endonuclease subunit S [Streptococcus anginosus]|nr:restriction endonuclease subunit S [Streptococcus anginosus]MCW0925762.1 restriction endonuclease subunit S [Streptococcus anginosus]
MNILEEIQSCSVEWKELGEVCSVKKGKQLNKNLLIEDGLYPAYNGGQTYSGRTNDYNVEANTIIVSQGGASAGFVNFVDTKFWANAHCYYILPDETRVNNRFVYHFVKMNQKYLMDFQHGAGIPALKADKLTKLLLPIPPQEIQEKIVQILDKFTDYVTELTSELTSRKKQYSFYRDKLLSFEDEVYQVEWKKLNECLKKGKGTKITASQMKLLHKDGAPIRIFAGGKTYADVNYGDIPDKDIHTEEAIVVKSRGIIDFEYCTEPFSFKNEFWSYSSDNENINLRYIYHYLVHNKEHFQNIANNMQMPQISSNDTEKFKIPVPSLEIQSRIVQVLDNFDTVCHDLNIGLPKEIELRQKQYEFFREKLLTFVAEGEYTESRVEEWDNSAIIKLLQWVFGPIRVELGAMARYSRTRIEATKLTSENYVGVDNLLQDRNGKTVATYLPEQGSFTGYDQGDILIGNIRPYLKKIWYANQSGGTNGDVLVIQNLFPSCLESQYLYYVLSDDRFFFYDMQYAKGSKMPRGDKAAIMQYKFILPPLSEQERIVSILDNFNTLTNSLSEGLPKEIELRQKQYEYRREQLLNFNR